MRHIDFYEINEDLNQAVFESQTCPSTQFSLKNITNFKRLLKILIVQSLGVGQFAEHN